MEREKWVEQKPSRSKENRKKIHERENETMETRGEENKEKKLSSGKISKSLIIG